MSTKDVAKKEHEKELLFGFLETEEGKKWQRQYKIISSSCEENDPLDFIFKSADGRTIGVEVVRFIAKTENGKATQHLKTIGNKLCSYAKKEHGLTLDILITPYDKRKFSPKWSDHVSLYYNPGFSKKFNKGDLKSGIEKIIDENVEELKQGQLITKWIEASGETLKINMNTCVKPNCSINNAGWCKKDPFIDIQQEIDKKNGKIQEYLNKCDECHLLIAIVSSEEGNYCWFTKDVSEVKFNHKFKSLQFYKQHYNFFDKYGIQPKTT